MEDQVDKRLLDEAVDAYVDWREECASVWDAYERWTSAPAGDARSRFSAYQAALDREERASNAYAYLIMPVGAGMPTGAGLFAPTLQPLHW